MGGKTLSCYLKSNNKKCPVFVSHRLTYSNILDPYLAITKMFHIDKISYNHSLSHFFSSSDSHKPLRLCDTVPSNLNLENLCMQMTYALQH